MLTDEEQEACNNKKGSFNTCNTKFKPQYNETIKSLQFYKLIMQSNESMEEWMGRLRTAAVICNYKEIDRQLKEQFIHGLNDEGWENAGRNYQRTDKMWKKITIHSKNEPGQKE